MLPVKIAIYAREPVPGRTKTRLARELGDAAACALHRAFVIDTVARCRAAAGLEPEIHGADPGPFLGSLGLPVVAQRAGELGARMSASLAIAPLIVGTDAPTLPLAVLHQATGALARADVVLTPVADGGYVLIGTRADPAFLEDRSIRWSSRHALADTIRAAHARHLRVALTAPHHDVDTADDLRLLRAHLARDPRAAPATAAALAAIASRNSHGF